MLDNLDKKIIAQIKKEKIKPFSRSFFMIKKIFFWIFISVFLVFSGLSLSITVMMIKYGDWDIYHFLDLTPTFFILKAFPYLWLLGVVIFLFLVLFKTKKADGTYNYSLFFRLITGLVIIIFLAIVFYFSGFSRNTESYLADNKIYVRFNYLRSSWQNPEKGLIAGNLKINEKTILEDLSGKSWVLLFPEDSFPGQELLLNNEKVKIIGEIISRMDDDSNYFMVQEFRSWKCGCPHCARMEGDCHRCSSGGGFCRQDVSCEFSEN